MLTRVCFHDRWDIPRVEMTNGQDEMLKKFPDEMQFRPDDIKSRRD